ncbi:caspase-3-like [Coccinella septempunctata]|uniref:caspase-3-like n=1 Tax=Coccinella septempunctata TaxID=41139 RepID=UPI001D07D5F3|nr:caspase-3-like [Coccinella septempunctata]
MQKKFRDIIKQHFPILVDEIEPEAFAHYLLRKKVLKKGEVNRILADRGNYKHNNRLLLFQILKKSDAHYHDFVEGLELFQLKHLFVGNPRSHIKVFYQGNQNTPDEELVDFSNLTLHSPVDRNNRTSTSAITNYNEKPLDVKVKLATNFQQTDSDNVYDAKSSNRGQVLIINNIVFDSHSRREGSEHDVKCLESLFKQMFFKVEIESELSVTEMEKVIRRFAAFNSNKISDICIVVIMSHGEERNKDLVVIDKTNNGLSTSWIEEQFTNVNCGLFSGKPKILLYQMCRGIQDDYAITSSPRINRDPSSVQYDSEDSVQTDSGNMLLPVERRVEDMLIGYATQKGHRAHRDPNVGSWYIQLICKVFMEKAHNTDIVSMLNEVDRKLRSRASPQYTMQTASYTSNGFNKLLYFNPGIYLDNVGNTQRFVESVS